MRIAQVVEHLRTTQPQFVVIGGAVDFQRAANELTRTPAAFVFPVRASARENQLENATMQFVGESFLVLLAVKGLSDRAGVAALDALEDAREPVLEALHGWQIDTEHDPVEYAGGELLAFEDDVLWWADTWVTGHYMRTTQ